MAPITQHFMLGFILFIFLGAQTVKGAIATVYAVLPTDTTDQDVYEVKGKTIISAIGVGVGGQTLYEEKVVQTALVLQRATADSPVTLYSGAPITQTVTFAEGATQNHFTAPAATYAFTDTDGSSAQQIVAASDQKCSMDSTNMVGTCVEVVESPIAAGGGTTTYTTTWTGELVALATVTNAGMTTRSIPSQSPMPTTSIILNSSPDSASVPTTITSKVTSGAGRSYIAHGTMSSVLAGLASISVITLVGSFAL